MRIREGIMASIRQRVLVHPFFLQVADDYRGKVKRDFGFDIPRTKVSYQMAEVFKKMIDTNGMPSFQKRNKRIGRRKVNTLIINWEFPI